MMDAVSGESCLADLLTHWRQRNALQVRDAARRAGVQPRTWTSWESGAAPQLSVLSELAAALGVRCTDLLALVPERLGESSGECGEVAACIRTWRRREAMSLGRAARRLGVSPSTVLDWESGRQPRQSQLSKLVAAGIVAR